MLVVCAGLQAARPPSKQAVKVTAAGDWGQPRAAWRLVVAGGLVDYDVIVARGDQLKVLKGGKPARPW